MFQTKKEQNLACNVEGCSMYGHKFSKAFNYRRHMEKQHGIIEERRKKIATETLTGSELAKKLPKKGRAQETRFFEWFEKQAGVTLEDPESQSYLRCEIEKWKMRIYEQAKTSITCRIKVEKGSEVMRQVLEIQSMELGKEEKKILIAKKREELAKAIEAESNYEIMETVRDDYDNLEKLKAIVMKGGMKKAKANKKVKNAIALSKMINEFMDGRLQSKTCPFCSKPLFRRNRHLFRNPCKVIMTKIKLLNKNKPKLEKFVGALVNLVLDSKVVSNYIAKRAKKIISRLKAEERPIRNLLRFVYMLMKRHLVKEVDFEKMRLTKDIAVRLIRKQNVRIYKRQMRFMAKTIVAEVKAESAKWDNQQMIQQIEKEVPYRPNTEEIVSKLQKMMKTEKTETEKPTTIKKEYTDIEKSYSNGFFYFNNNMGFDGLSSTEHAIQVFGMYNDKEVNQKALEVINSVDFLKKIKLAFSFLPSYARELFTCKYLYKRENVYKAYIYHKLSKANSKFMIELFLKGEMEEASAITKEVISKLHRRNMDIAKMKNLMNQLYGFSPNRPVTESTPALILRKIYDNFNEPVSSLRIDIKNIGLDMKSQCYKYELMNTNYEEHFLSTKRKAEEIKFILDTDCGMDYEEGKSMRGALQRELITMAKYHGKIQEKEYLKELLKPKETEKKYIVERKDKIEITDYYYQETTDDEVRRLREEFGMCFEEEDISIKEEMFCFDDLHVENPFEVEETIKMSESEKSLTPSKAKAEKMKKKREEVYKEWGLLTLDWLEKMERHPDMEALIEEIKRIRAQKIDVESREMKQIRLFIFNKMMKKSTNLTETEAQIKEELANMCKQNVEVANEEYPKLTKENFCEDERLKYVMKAVKSKINQMITSRARYF